MASPVICPACKNSGLLAAGKGVQYCMCPVGREKKKQWYSLPADLREQEESVSPTLPDLDDLRGVA